jgi:NTP pyrophosphatase (non-canonical NTP hydrolase)
MNLNQFQEMCKKTAIVHDNKEKEIMTLGLGISGEAGDVAGCIKKTFSHGDDQKSGIKENLGDTMWYVAMICNYFGWNVEDVLEENIAKLKKRYPDGFNVDGARKAKRKDWNEDSK